MKSHMHFVFIAVILFALCPLKAQLVSQQRLETGLNLALQYIQKHPGASQADVVASVKQQLLEQYPELAKNPAGQPISEIESLRDYNRKFTAIMDAKLPVLNDKQLRILAAEKYPLYTKNTPVKIYYKKGRDVESWSGKVAAIEDGRVKIGSKYIAFHEMEGIEGNELEILKFKPEETQKARVAYIQQEKQRTLNERENFKKTQHKAVEEELILRDRMQNEANGYTYYQNAWITPDVFFAAIANDCTAAMEIKRYEVLNEKLKDRRQIIDAQIEAVDRRYFYAPPGLVATPESVRRRELQQKVNERLDAQLIARKQERERLQKEKLEREKEEQLAAEKAQKEAAEKARLEAAEKERLAKEEEERIAKEEAAAQKAQRQPNVPMVVEAQPETIPFGFVVGATVALIILIVIVVMLISYKKKKDDKERFTKYFESKGKLQKDFWSKASSDPDHFKYVAYLFPSIQEATAALGHLSYIKTGNAGDLKCSRNLLFGVYEHLNGAVCFIGGANFSYALWREASAVLPELPNAQYFKVSTEPIVQLELPDVTKLSQEMNLHVEEIAVEDVAGENGEFNRLYRYSSDNQQMALDFLEKFNIHEAGIIVHVETPEGIYGKDENGVFTLEN